MGALDACSCADIRHTMLNGTETQEFGKESENQQTKDLQDLKMGMQERLYYQVPSQAGPESCSPNLPYASQSVQGYGVPSPSRFLTQSLSTGSYNPVRPQVTGGQGYSGPGVETLAPGSDMYSSSGDSYPTTVPHMLSRTPLYPVPGYQVSGKIQVLLNNHALWAKFHKYQTEMIITKQGRRMFPYLSFNITGLDPASHYSISVDIILADQHHWRYQGGKWVQCGKAEGNMPGNRNYVHPDSPNTGAHWMRQEISFGKLKLTNNKGASNNVSQMVVLQSLHKYQPRLHITEVKEGESDEPFQSSKTQTFIFPETQFIAVTAYQNADITQLKIDHNPFAKGFRDNFDPVYMTAEGERFTPSPKDTAACQQLMPPARYQPFLHEQYINPLPQGRFYNGDRSTPHAVQHKDTISNPHCWYFASQQATPAPLDHNSYEADYTANRFMPYGVKTFSLQTAPPHHLGYYQDPHFSTTGGWGTPRSTTQYHPRASTSPLAWYRPVRDLQAPLPVGDQKGKESEEPSPWLQLHTAKPTDSSEGTLYETVCKRKRVSPYASSTESSPPTRSGDHYEKDSGSDTGYYSFYGN
ncbi:T-box transcription factor TBX21 [Protopterus annectens]|uniref:T-box transcription factor TBX21 n=1 Tax=Protopterus annectens TaxID=7888 RepID=UPI001CFB9A60|nr:T-box transcription factor TBX21 [Protopterus annectens]